MKTTKVRDLSQDQQNQNAQLKQTLDAAEAFYCLVAAKPSTDSLSLLEARTVITWALRMSMNLMDIQKQVRIGWPVPNDWCQDPSQNSDGINYTHRADVVADQIAEALPGNWYPDFDETAESQAEVAGPVLCKIFIDWEPDSLEIDFLYWNRNWSSFHKVVIGPGQYLTMQDVKRYVNLAIGSALIAKSER